MPATTSRIGALARRSVGLLALTLLAGACGGTGEEAGETPSVAAGEEEARIEQTSEAPDGPAPAPGEVGAFTARITGTRDTTYALESAAAVEAATNCAIEKPARVSFTVTGDDELPTGRFRAITGVILEPGRTGSFRADTVTYWYPRMGLPSRTTYRGHGTLEITHHDARADSPRLVGRIVGEDLRDADGERVDFEAEFDIGRSCGIEE